MHGRIKLKLGIVVLLVSIQSEAKDICQEFKNYMPLPTWYSDACDSAGNAKAKIGGAYSTLGDAFNINPAAIITSSIPVGVEYIGSFQGSGFKNSFALIKGFGHFGTALTTNSDETFYGNSIFQTPGTGTQIQTSPIGQTNGANSSATGRFPTVNFGSAVDLASFLSENYRPLLFFNPTLGVMAKYNKVTGSVSPGFGFGGQIWKISFGYSYTEDPATSTSPKVQYDAVTLGIKTSILQFEWVTMLSRSVSVFSYTSQSNGTSSYQFSSFNVRPASFLTLSSKIGDFLLTVAARSYEDVNYTNHTQYHLAVEYIVSPKLAFEYLDNYVQDHRSLGVQVLF